MLNGLIKLKEEPLVEKHITQIRNLISLFKTLHHYDHDDDDGMTLHV